MIYLRRKRHQNLRRLFKVIILGRRSPRRAFSHDSRSRHPQNVHTTSPVYLCALTVLPALWRRRTRAPRTPIPLASAFPDWRRFSSQTRRAVFLSNARRARHTVSCIRRQSPERVPNCRRCHFYQKKPPNLTVREPSHSNTLQRQRKFKKKRRPPGARTGPSHELEVYDRSSAPPVGSTCCTVRTLDRPGDATAASSAYRPGRPADRAVFRRPGDAVTSSTAMTRAIIHENV